MHRDAGASERGKSPFMSHGLYTEMCTWLHLQTFEENSTLEGILGELIVPSVKRKELALREKGLVCLGLCCLIARVRPVAPNLWLIAF